MYWCHNELIPKENSTYENGILSVNTKISGSVIPFLFDRQLVELSVLHSSLGQYNVTHCKASPWQAGVIHQHTGMEASPPELGLRSWWWCRKLGCDPIWVKIAFCLGAGQVLPVPLYYWSPCFISTSYRLQSVGAILDTCNTCNSEGSYLRRAKLSRPSPAISGPQHKLHQTTFTCVWKGSM